MTVVDDIGNTLGAFGWNSLGGILFVFIFVFIFIMCFIIVGVFLWWKSFRNVVYIYTPLGQVEFTQEEYKEIEDEVNRGTKINDITNLQKIKFDYMTKKKTHGKDVTIKGTSYFHLFTPLKKIKPIPLAYRFSTGIYLLRLSKEIFIPIPKPNFILTVNQNISVSVAEQQEWITWSNMMADRVNAKYQNPDAQKQQTLYFVIGIAGMVLIGGFILWLIYSSAKKGMDIRQALEAMASSFKSNVGGGGIPAK